MPSYLIGIIVIIHAAVLSTSHYNYGETDRADRSVFHVVRDTVRPELPDYSINQIIRVEIVWVDEPKSEPRVVECDQTSAILQIEHNGKWDDVARANCVRQTEHSRKIGQSSNTLTFDFPVMSLPAGPIDGRYRVRIQSRTDGKVDDPESAALSEPFVVEDSPVVPQPERFAPGIISTEAEEWRITFTPEGDHAYFARSDSFFPISREASIFETRLIEGRWQEPVIASFSGTYPDIDPFITPDGSKLFFSSIRPVDSEPREDADVWYVEWNGKAWSEPVHTGALNSSSDELFPSVTSDGILFVASDRPNGLGGWDIYSALPRNGGYSSAENIASPVNTTGWDFNPLISPDGTCLVFTRLNDPDGMGLGDLYISRFIDDIWSPPENLGSPINTDRDEYHAGFSPDGRLMFFVRREDDGDIYVVDAPRNRPE